MNGKQLIKMEVPLKKRGRPQGKGRAPLSLEERRARNALYERERRAENSEAMADLAAAVGFSPDETKHADLLATVITLIKNAHVTDPTEDVDELKRVNCKLVRQIKDIECRIRTEPELAGLVIPDSDDDDPVPMRTHSNNESRKKLKIDPSPSPVPCSRTSVDAYDWYRQRKRERTQLQPLPAGTSMGNKTSSELTTAPAAPLQPVAAEIDFVSAEPLPVLDHDFLLKYLPS